MLPDLHRTIVALASGAQGAERAIVRLAGPDTAAIVQALCSRDLGPSTVAPTVVDAPGLTWCDCEAFLPRLQRWLPLTLLYWPDERSYTGCPAAELHFVGALPLAEAIIDRCCQLGAQVAGRGEFTLRAFLAGKLDLAQAEAVLGVIQADSQDTLATALAQLGGNLAPAVAPLRETVIGVLAELEAGLDFVDEDIQFIDSDQLLRQLQIVAHHLQQFAVRLDTRSSTDLVPKVVLAGLPNSGKSTLFNALAGKELAIVADVAGTTRDYLQHRITVEDTAFDLLDTAGWELLADHSPRALAQAKLNQCLDESEFGVLCIDLSNPDDWSAVTDYLMSLPGSDVRWIIVGTKNDCATDQGRHALREAAQRLNVAETHCLVTSYCSGESIFALRRTIAQLIRSERTEASVDPLALVHETAVRCRSALHAAQTALQAAIELVQAGDGEELVAAELRLVIEDLSTIIGQVHSDDVLGEIFSRFCIGK